MAISWNVDELRSTVAAQMAEANRLDEVIDVLAAERDAAELELSQERFMRQAAEAEVSKWKENNGILLDTANRLRSERNAAVDRANVAEAEVERLREKLAAWT